MTPKYKWVPSLSDFVQLYGGDYIDVPTESINFELPKGAIDAQGIHSTNKNEDITEGFLINDPQKN